MKLRNTLKVWVQKIREFLKPPPAEFSLTQQLIITLGSTITICLLYGINYLLGKADILLLAPFIASPLMIFTMPNNPMTSATTMLQSYVLCALISFAFVYVFEYSQWVLIAAFGICFFLMLPLDCLHPPAIMLPFIIIGEQMRDYSIAFNPILIDVVILLISTYLFNKVLRRLPKVEK